MKRLFKILRFVLLALTGLLLILALILRVRYGGGEPYPNVATDPLLPKSALETVFSYDEPLGNLTVTADNRIFFTVHPESRPTGHKVLEVVNNKALPYPNDSFQKSHFNTVLGVVTDEKNRLWTIDHGNHGFQTTRISAFDLSTNDMVYDHVFSSDIAEKGSFFNDLQVSPDGRYVYIADVSFFGKNPSLVVHDTQTKTSTRWLENHESVTPQDWIIHNPIKKMLFIGGLVALKPGIDGIALGPKGEFVYYGAMTHDGLYKIPTQVLHDFSQSPEQVDQQVIRIGQKPLSDGLSTDTLHQVYITDVENSGVARMSPAGELTTLIRSEKIRWADALSFGGDGHLYIADSAIPDQMLRSKGHMRKSAPYYIYRINPGVGGVPGR